MFSGMPVVSLPFLQFEKRAGALFIDCVGEMAVVGEGETVFDYTKKWFDMVNRSP